LAGSTECSSLLIEEIEVNEQKTIVTIRGRGFGRNETVVSVNLYTGNNRNGCPKNCEITNLTEISSARYEIKCTPALSEGTAYFGVTKEGANSPLFQYEYIEKGELKNIPTDKTLTEGRRVEYAIELSLNNTKSVTVQIHDTKHICSVHPSTITFASYNTSKRSIVVTAPDNDIDEEWNETCQIQHTIDSDDDNYHFENPSPEIYRFQVHVKNDDNADVKLKSISDYTGDYEYSLKFLPFFVTEGGNISYGLCLDTAPTRQVIIRPNITLNNADSVLEPPVLRADPVEFAFDASNWNVTQRVTIRSIPDDVDNEKERFQVAHNIITADAIFLAKATEKDLLVVVDLIDNDAAGILLTSKVVEVVEGGKWAELHIGGLTSQPVHDVSLYLDLPSDKFEVDNQTNPVVIAKRIWQNSNTSIKLRALADAPSGTYTIRSVSEDPAYNKTENLATDITISVKSIGTPPNTNITHFPPKVSAWTENVSFGVYSPDGGVKKITWNLDDGTRGEIDCNGTSLNCEVFIPLVLHGSHRFEAQAVLDDLKDPAPAFFEWEIAHCNSNATYAEINKNTGALKCIDCPHREGANCLTSDIEWEGVYANPGWWTAGNREDTYYKCPLKDTCLGGNISSPQNSTAKLAIKSICSPGSSGVVCAVCDDGFYMMDDRCIPCPTQNGGSEALVAVTFSVTLGGFMFALLRQKQLEGARQGTAGLEGSQVARRRRIGHARLGGRYFFFVRHGRQSQV